MAYSWRYSKRTGNNKKFKVSQDPEDFYRLDVKKSTAENAYEIYTALCCSETRDTKRLFLLNGLATLCQQQYHWQQKQQQHQQHHHHQQQQQQQQQRQQQAALNATTTETIGFSTEELLYCLSANLIHTFAQVRAAALRTIRYALATPTDLKVFNAMQLQHLLCRSIDLMIKNDDERVQALKLVRKMLIVSPDDISPVLVRCLVSLAECGVEDGDNMLRACLATLCEFAILNPMTLIVCGGVTAITRNVLECHNPRIAESLCGVLLYLLEWPHTRKISGVRLDCLAAPYCDFTYRLGITDKNKDARELRYTSCRLALLSVLRSWTGTIEFCDPSKPSGLKAIVDALYLNQSEVRKAILDLIYELLGLPQPSWTDDYAVALQTMDPSDFQDAWLLSNGFVAMEGRSILPSLAARAPNVCTQHLALLLYCFLETGLLNALIEVIVATDTHLSVRATALIGKILQLMHTHLPADISSTSSALPSLITHATQGNPNATAAISALQTYQKMLRNRPASCSLFLDSIIQGGTLISTRLFQRDISSLDQLQASNLHSTISYDAFQARGGGTFERTRPHLDSVSSGDESASQSSSSGRSSFRLKRKLLPFFENYRVNRLIKESNVLSSSEVMWDWEIVTAILRSNLIRKIDDTTGKFLKALVAYFKPSSNRFSHQDLALGRSMPPYVMAGIDLINFLLNGQELENMRLLTDFFTDISLHLLAVRTSTRAHDCLFSPQHMSNTMCQQYFLYIGRMCRSQKGISILTNTTIFEHLKGLVETTDHVCYIKLIVSGLDYSLDSATRKVLETALKSAKIRSGRLYATQFLVVLLRARIPNFVVWGIRMIIQQTRDPDRSVVLAALDVLEEACHEEYYLEEIVSLWPNLKSLGDIGRLVMARYYSLSRGLNHSNARIKEEIEYWKNGYNKRYVLLVEADTHASLTLHVRNEEGYYSRRNCNMRPIIIPPNMPAHIYGSMVQKTQGITALRKYGDLPHLVDVVSRGKCSDDAECLELKAAIWAIGHASTHSNGIDYFVESGSRIYEKLVKLATKCDVNSIRATCFSVLGLIGGTNAGANLLFKLDWLSVRHDRNVVWPVHQPEDWMSTSYYTPVRHHYEDVPPYNYTSIEDQIDGSYYTGSYSNLLLSSSSTTKDGGGGVSGSSDVHDANTTIDSSKVGVEELLQKSATVGVTTIAAKSKTLPEGAYTRCIRHQRSLSESKTTDEICPMSTATVLPSSVAYHQHHRTRHNSWTDSNTSGVSSCESVTVRGSKATGDFQQFPLSPIPSMSNLLEIPQKQAQLLRRRTSLVGASMSPVDVKGYAQVRSLRRHCRPVLSESATDFYDFINSSDLASHLAFRLRISSFGDAQRRLKVRSLDRQSSLRVYNPFDTEELQVPLPTLNAPKFLSQNDSEGPIYAGICLPKNLLDLFPSRNMTRTYVSCDIQDQDLMVSDINLLTARQHLLNDSLNIGDGEGGDESVISSLSDISSVSKRPKWMGVKHGRGNCLHCSRLRRTRAFATAHRVDATDVATTSAAAATSSSSAAAAAAAVADQAAMASLMRKTMKPPSISTQQSSSTIQLSDISFNSPESILSEESMSDRVTANILYNVQRLANPVSAKQSKMSLLELKQKYSASFQNICLYSEVCRTLGRGSYRMSARRFVQELFLDLNFDEFYAEPMEIISKKEKHFKPTAPDKIDAAATAAGHQHHQHQREKRAPTQIDHNVSVGDSNGHYASGCDSDSATATATTTTTTPTTASSSSSATKAATVGVGGITTTATATTTTTPTTTTTHKPHLKSQPLESVHEVSCENLLQENSPRLQTATTATTTPVNAVLKGEKRRSQPSGGNKKVTSSSLHGGAAAAPPTRATNMNNSNVTPPPPAAPPPAQRRPNNLELRITTSSDDYNENDDDDDDDYGDGGSSCGGGHDEVDGVRRYSSNSNSSATQPNRDLQQLQQQQQQHHQRSLGSVNTPLSGSSNYSDQTNTTATSGDSSSNSNRSSTCNTVISRHRHSSTPNATSNRNSTIATITIVTTAAVDAAGVIAATTSPTGTNTNTSNDTNTVTNCNRYSNPTPPSPPPEPQPQQQPLSANNSTNNNSIDKKSGKCISSSSYILDNNLSFRRNKFPIGDRQALSWNSTAGTGNFRTPAYHQQHQQQFLTDDKEATNRTSPQSTTVSTPISTIITTPTTAATAMTANVNATTPTTTTASRTMPTTNLLESVTAKPVVGTLFCEKRLQTSK